MYIGDFVEGQQVLFFWQEQDGTLAVYKDQLTSQATQAGVETRADHDGVDGLNCTIIRTEEDPGYYRAGNDFFVLVGGVLLIQFSIENRRMRGTDHAANYSLDEVWSHPTRTLTSAANLNDPSAAQIWDYAKRTLTANTNLNDPPPEQIAHAVWRFAERTLSKGTNLNDLSAKQVWEYTRRALTTQEGLKLNDPSAEEVAGTLIKMLAGQLDK